MTKILITIGILVGLLTLAASTLMFGLLMLAFSTDGIHGSSKLPEGILALFAFIAFGFLLYGSIAPAVLYWNEASWHSIFWTIKVGFGGAVVALIIDWVIIIKIATA